MARRTNQHPTMNYNIYDIGLCCTHNRMYNYLNSRFPRKRSIELRNGGLIWRDKTKDGESHKFRREIENRKLPR